jgi:hypothetical protein
MMLALRGFERPCAWSEVECGRGWTFKSDTAVPKKYVPLNFCGLASPHELLFPLGGAWGCCTTALTFWMNTAML